MEIFFFVVVLLTALYLVLKVLLPEMAKPPLPSKAPEPEFIELNIPDDRDQRIEKLDSLLAEKNKNIQVLQTELKVLQVQVYNFDTVKILLEEEVHRLREINRVFRSELGLPPASMPRVNSMS